ncbi:MAG: DNA cytosine methyltransferase [Desulfobacteria bacterium]
MDGFYEFFAGGGMARLGLGPDWKCLFANDICEKKASAYRANFDGAPELIVKDIRSITPAMLPRGATLAWGSFPCQDLSLAGNYNGLDGERSGVFWPFWKIIRTLDAKGRTVPLVVIENVEGLLTSKDGEDFKALVSIVAKAGYRVGAMVLDASHFLPQSRPRLFVVAVKGLAIPESAVRSDPHPLWHTKTMVAGVRALPEAARKAWVWFNPPYPREEVSRLSELIEDRPTGVRWHTKEETNRIIGMMSDVNLEKIRFAQHSTNRMIGAIYKRTRKFNGASIQRAEVRFDISGCLRTPVGGSSRQIILVVEGKKIRSRLLSPREAARLMGVPDGYKLPDRYNDAYHLMGDGLAVPVVRHLAEHILTPILEGRGYRRAEEG